MPEESDKKDLNLNLDKYIFNIDDDILKFIEPRKEEKALIKIRQKQFAFIKGVKYIKMLILNLGN